MKQTICIAGQNDIAVNVLEFCLEKFQNDRSISFACILTKGDKGVNGWQRSLKWYCDNKNVKIVQLEDVYNIENLLFLSVQFDRIIKTDKFRTDKLFNIHFSLLPQYKGMYPTVLPILHDQEMTGVTLHRIRDGIDTGEIIAQKKFRIDEEDTSLDIYRKDSIYGAELVNSYLERLLNNDYICVPQSSQHSTYYSRETIDYSNLSLNIRATAHQIKNQVRAFAFRPYQLLEFNGVSVIQCKVTNEVSRHKPGSIIEEDKIFFKISTMDYNVILYKDVLQELFDAIKNADNEAAKKFCMSKAVINDKDEHGWSPLIVAVYYNNLEMVNYLLDQGADIHVCNNNGTNLLMYAKDAYKNTGENRLFRLLKSKGLDEFQKDFFGNDLLYYIKKDGISIDELLYK